MVRLGEPLSKDELDDIIQDAKVDRDGRINYTGISYERNPVFGVSDTNQPVPHWSIYTLHCRGLRGLAGD